MNNYDNDDGFDEFLSDDLEERNYVLWGCICVALLFFMLIMGISCLGRECKSGHDSSCTAYEGIQNAKNWVIEKLVED